MGATRPASGFLRQRFTNKRVISAVCEPLFGVWAFALMRGTRRPISACVLCLSFMLAFCGSRTFTILQKLYLPSILHLTLTRYNSLVINTLISVRYCKFHLHTTYTTYTLPHGTSTGGRHHGIGEQESLLLRQISLRPYGVNSAAHVQTDCAAAGCDV